MSIKFSIAIKILYCLIVSVIFIHIYNPALAQNSVDDLIGSYQTRYIHGESEANDIIIIHYNKQGKIEIIWKNFIDNEKIYHLNPFSDLQVNGDEVSWNIKFSSSSPSKPEPTDWYLRFVAKREGDEIFGPIIFPPNHTPREQGSIYMKKISD